MFANVETSEAENDIRLKLAYPRMVERSSLLSESSYKGG